jgi:hypothetical protein
LNFLDRFSKNIQISNFMKIRRVGAELFNADRQTDKHDEADSCFSQFVKAPKNCSWTQTGYCHLTDSYKDIKGLNLIQEEQIVWNIFC